MSMYDPLGGPLSQMSDEDILTKLNRMRELRNTQAGGRFQMVSDNLEFMIEILEREHHERYARNMTSDRNKKTPTLNKPLSIGEIDAPGDTQ